MLQSVLPVVSAPSVGLEPSDSVVPSKNVVYGSDSRHSLPPNTGLHDLKSGIVENVQEIAVDRPSLDLNASHIKSSPYSDPLNFLNLTDLDKPLRCFALALTRLQSTRPDYATAPYMSSFNWNEVFGIVRNLCAQAGIQWQREDFYVVIFRSKLRAEADRTRLGELDQMSHQEACSSGGLLTYWFGNPDVERRNLATCVWCNREDAAAGGKGPWHRKARGAAREMYENITFHTHKLVVEEGAKSWILEDYYG